MKLGGRRLAAMMVELLLLGIAVGSQQRGPHHPRAAVSGEATVEKLDHKHPSPKSNTKFTDDKPILHDVRHIEEDLGYFDELEDKTYSEEEIEFRYFTVHDYDKNTKLDGLELLIAFHHNAERQEDAQPIPMEETIDLVDQILEEDDTDNDGFLSYTEYIIAKNG
ncbi:multiple coagulation factor deficiency protein 2 homolog [Adelges cooleyi]|uniref:multiple coagulation factor deficiency protein 2 homolog n=1 Tax=Adelges cooleyi TaxID=133065 RepID=UPI0021802A6F|nr:multiple coagulation factor deficiency protein 2 homolog [Adelges cooleyi]XP_050425274.1 multiple coagulation factor deficiency protein 2 homolog [Adelges cooleyi]XP_050425275.1 multiple coagulation factor deficiency protein 2 homolog [Adelges cooleyi]XP_050425276.1 multiple coagulation factor deficiency protein 2 homolog [Adelges cooleyi]